jgi:hypothetical protein
MSEAHRGRGFDACRETPFLELCQGPLEAWTAVDNFVDKHCEDALSPRQALSSIGHNLTAKWNLLFNFNRLGEKIKLCRAAIAGEPHK